MKCKLQKQIHAKSSTNMEGEHGPIWWVSKTVLIIKDLLNPRAEGIFNSGHLPQRKASARWFLESIYQSYCLYPPEMIPKTSFIVFISIGQNNSLWSKKYPFQDVTTICSILCLAQRKQNLYVCDINILQWRNGWLHRITAAWNSA